MVRRVAFLKPVGTLTLDFRIKGGVTEILGCRTQELFPLSLEVEIPDLIAQGDKFALPCDACRFKQVDNNASVYTQLVVVARKCGFALEIVEMLHRIEPMAHSCIQVEWDVIVILFVSQAAPFQAVPYSSDQSGVCCLACVEQGVERPIESSGRGGLVIVQLIV